MMKLSVHLVTWNGEAYIPYLFDSLKKQTFSDWELVVFDNGSTDGTLDRINIETKNFPRPVRIIKNKENIGFAGGHNQLFRETHSTYILLLNVDMYLEPDCFEKMIAYMDAHQDIAAISPRLMAWHIQKMQHEKLALEQSFSDSIDSLGLKVFRNRRVVDWHAGERWEDIQKEMLEHAVEVFGVSGALPMYRGSALRAIAFLDGNVFDPSYGSYKEDVDLAFRLRSAGYRAYTLLDAVAYHDRSAAGPRTPGDAVAARNKANQPRRIRYQSYRNHLATLYKNSYWQADLLDFPWMFWYELKKLLFYFFFDPGVLRGWIDLWRMREDLRRRKDQIEAKRTVGWREMWKHIEAS